MKIKIYTINACEVMVGIETRINNFLTTIKDPNPKIWTERKRSFYNLNSNDRHQMDDEVIVFIAYNEDRERPPQL